MNKSLQQMLSLKGKTALITGGAGWLGTAISETLAELGANIILASRDRAKCAKKCDEIVQQTGGSIRAAALELDLLKKGTYKPFFDEVHKQFGAIDILVNNAWSGKKNSWESVTDEDWEYDINMSLNSVFRLTKAAFPDLKETRGVILNIPLDVRSRRTRLPYLRWKGIRESAKLRCGEGRGHSIHEVPRQLFIAAWHPRQRPQPRGFSPSADSEK